MQLAMRCEWVKTSIIKSEGLPLPLQFCGTLLKRCDLLGKNQARIFVKGKTINLPRQQDCVCDARGFQRCLYIVSANDMSAF
jgi:hypothetical protein